MEVSKSMELKKRDEAWRECEKCERDVMNVQAERTTPYEKVSRMKDHLAREFSETVPPEKRPKGKKTTARVGVTRPLRRRVS
jgi:ribosomal protein L34E